MKQEEINNLVNNENVLNTFVNLSARWEDEKQYEEFNDYVEVMSEAVTNAIGKIENVSGCNKPFGINFTKDGDKLRLFLKTDSRYAWLAVSRFVKHPNNN